MIELDRTLSRLRRLSAVCVVLSVTACGSPGQTHTNLLLVTIDTLRDDHCSVSGYERQTTPHLEALARDGARMKLAYAPTATTGPSHASILTSLYPIAHGVRKNGMTLDSDVRTLTEALADSGYAAGAVVSSFVLDRKFGYGQGFDLYDDQFDQDSASIRRSTFEGHEVEGAFDRRADTTTHQAIAMIDQFARGDRPFFAFVHYFDPHAPYVPPAAFKERFSAPAANDELAAAIRAYDGEVAFVDEQVGVLLEHLKATGLEDDTLVVVTSDHGEGLMQHGHLLHGVHIYEEAVRVPLLFRMPGKIHRGSEFSEPVELVDLMPTILDLLDVRLPAGLQGHSLAEPLRGEAELDASRPIHLYRRHYEPQRVLGVDVAGEKFGIRVGRFKYIEGHDEGSRELFDLELDPGEERNLIDTSEEIARELAAEIAAWKLRFGRAPTPSQPIAPEDIERLRALGYTQ